MKSCTQIYNWIYYCEQHQPPELSPDVTTVYTDPCLIGQCNLLFSSLWNCKSLNTSKYIQAFTSQPYNISLVQDHAHSNQCCVVMKIGNIVIGVGI